MAYDKKKKTGNMTSITKKGMPIQKEKYTGDIETVVQVHTTNFSAVGNFYKPLKSKFLFFFMHPGINATCLSFVPRRMLPSIFPQYTLSEKMVHVRNIVGSTYFLPYKGSHTSGAGSALNPDGNLVSAHRR